MPASKKSTIQAKLQAKGVSPKAASAMASRASAKAKAAKK